MQAANTRIANLETRTRRPTSPGEMVAGLLEELNLSQTELASRLGVSRGTINSLIRGHRTLTPDMAARLGAFFGDGGAVWLRMQQNVDMWDYLHATPAVAAEIRPYEREPVAA